MAYGVPWFTYQIAIFLKKQQPEGTVSNEDLDLINTISPISWDFTMVVGLKLEDISAHKNDSFSADWRHETQWMASFFSLNSSGKEAKRCGLELLVPGIPEDDLRPWWRFHYLYWFNSG